nr:excalibur calcium-binding domain-containing protein [Nocardioides ungokensis]
MLTDSGAPVLVPVNVTAPSAPSTPSSPAAGGGTGGSVYYENCDAARAAGAAPLHRGDPGYGPHLDGDGDGVACE